MRTFAIPFDLSLQVLCFEDGTPLPMELLERFGVILKERLLAEDQTDFELVVLPSIKHELGLYVEFRGLRSPDPKAAFGFAVDVFSDAMEFARYRIQEEVSG